MTPSLDDRILGLVYGAACADALGGPVEGLDHRELSARHGRVDRMLPYPKPPAEHAQFTAEPGSVTDDTRLHRIHIDALVASGGRALAGDLALAIDRWRDAHRGTLERAFVEEYHYAALYREAKLPFGGHGTNGAIMANHAVGVVHAADPRSAYRTAFELAYLSDGYGKDAAALHAAAVAAALRPGATARSAIEEAYARGETDEFVAPTVVAAEGEAPARVQDGDAVLFFNFRADRARQLAHAFLDGDDWDGFDRGRVPDVGFASLMQLEAAIDAPFALALPELEEPLAEVIARAGLAQHHTAETEKYPHVTYFFNAKVEEPYPGESRYLEPSPKVPTYDLQPEMSAPALADACAARIRNHDDAFVLINFANPDMVGHTGVLEAAIAACEAADTGLGVVLEALEARGGVALIVADHGNAEQMHDADGNPHTAHTTNPVPCVLVHGPEGARLRGGGILGDVAPTVLELLGLEQPAAMTGRSLLEGDRD